MEILRQVILPIPDNVNLSEQIKLFRHANDCLIEKQSMMLIFRVTRHVVPPSMGGFVVAPFEAESMKVSCKGCEREGPDDLLNPIGPGFLFWRITKEQKDVRDRLNGMRKW